MAGDVIAVNLAGSELRIETSPESPLLEIQHRIFFVNVLDLASDRISRVTEKKVLMTQAN